MGTKPGDVDPSGNNPKEPGGPTDDPNSEEIEALRRHKERILSEKKKLQADLDAKAAKLAEFEEKERLKEQQTLEQKGEYEKALELERKRVREATEKLEALSGQVQEGQKLSAFLEAVNGTVDKKYWGLIDLSQIKLDESGEIDKDSVNTAVATFTESYGNEIIRKPGGAELPPGAPRDGGGSSNKISYEDWLKLPPDQMKKRMKDVITNT